jgi:hypothetical protein
MRYFWLIGPTAAILALTPSIAEAVCARSDLQGSWDAYSVGADNRDPFWTRCTVRFAASGNIRSASCRDDDGEASTLAGTLRVRNNCRANGTVTEEFSGGSIDCSIRSTLSPAKDVVAGVGECDEGTIFTFSMIKR